jgi:hypothetical protein
VLFPRARSTIKETQIEFNWLQDIGINAYNVEHNFLFHQRRCGFAYIRKGKRTRAHHHNLSHEIGRPALSALIKMEWNRNELLFRWRVRFLLMREPLGTLVFFCTASEMGYISFLLYFACNNRQLVLYILVFTRSVGSRMWILCKFGAQRWKFA